MNKTRWFPMLFASLAMLALPAYVLPASLGLTTGSPSLTSSFSLVDYLEFAPDGDLSTFGAEIDSTDGVAPVGFTELSFGVGFALSDPTVGATGGFDIFDEDGFFLGGDLIAVGFAEDVIEFQFGTLSGAGVGGFGSSVLVQVLFDDALGSNPFASLVDGEFYTGSITVSNVVDVSPVPLPAALPLFLSGLIGLGWLGKRRSQR